MVSEIAALSNCALFKGIGSNFRYSHDHVWAIFTLLACSEAYVRTVLGNYHLVNVEYFSIDLLDIFIVQRGLTSLAFLSYLMVLNN